MASAWRSFKNIFSRPLFTIIFRPKILILGTDSILRVKMMYESVKWDVLIHLLWVSFNIHISKNNNVELGVNGISRI